MYLGFVCSRKTKGGAEGCSKGPSSRWQCYISAAAKKEREALMHLFLPQLKFTSEIFLAFLVVVVVVLVLGFFSPLGVSTSILQTCQASNKLMF